MSTPKSDLKSQSESDKYIKELGDQLTLYHILDNEAPDIKAIRVSMIHTIISLLKDKDINLNKIYSENPNIFYHLFSQMGPGHEILVQHGFDFNTRSSDGTYPLLRACQQGSAPVTKFLLQHGARFDIPHMGRTAVAEATAHPYFDASILETDVDCKEFMEQYHLIQNSMFLAMRWSLNGAGNLENNHFEKLNFAYPSLLRNSLYQTFIDASQNNKDVIRNLCGRFCSTITNDDIKLLIENIATRAKSADAPKVKDLMENILAGNTCPLAVETEFSDGGKHHECIIFAGNDTLLRVNRGEGSDGRTGIEINTITKPENIEDFLSIFLSTLARVDAESFHALAEEQLGLQKIRLINMKEQSAPSCKWTSEKAAFYGVIYCELRSLLKEKGLDAKTADESALLITKAWYKSITKKDRMKMVRTVLEMFPGKSIDQMPMLIKEMLFKIYKKSSIKEKYLPIKTLLEERGMKTFLI